MSTCLENRCESDGQKQIFIGREKLRRLQKTVAKYNFYHTGKMRLESGITEAGIDDDRSAQYCNRYMDICLTEVLCFVRPNLNKNLIKKLCFSFSTKIIAVIVSKRLLRIGFCTVLCCIRNSRSSKRKN